MNKSTITNDEIEHRLNAYYNVFQKAAVMRKQYIENESNNSNKLKEYSEEYYSEEDSEEDTETLNDNIDILQLVSELQEKMKRPLIYTVGNSKVFYDVVSSSLTLASNNVFILLMSTKEFFMLGKQKLTMKFYSYSDSGEAIILFELSKNELFTMFNGRNITIPICDTNIYDNRYLTANLLYLEYMN